MENTEIEKTCQNCKFWGNLKEELKNASSKLSYSTKIKLFRAENKIIEDFKKKDVRECQKISNASTLLTRYESTPFIVLKKTDKNWECKLWEKRETEEDESAFLLKKKFSEWFEIFYPRSEIVKYPEGIKVPDVNKIFPTSLLNPLTWKNYAMHNYLKERIKFGYGFDRPGEEITEKEFNLLVGQCKLGVKNG